METDKTDIGNRPQFQLEEPMVGVKTSGINSAEMPNQRKTFPFRKIFKSGFQAIH